MVQDALVSALQAWRLGIPDDPSAWLLRTAKNCGPKEIAQAFLTETERIDKRLYRGRTRLEALGEPDDISDPERVSVRLPSVLRALYLLFNEGDHGSDATGPLRGALCAEAMRLAELLTASHRTALPEVLALRALFGFHAARLSTRLDADGVFVPLELQDRREWNRDLIDSAMQLLGASATGTVLSRWHLEAGIACEHATAPSLSSTNWARIVERYDLLFAIVPTPIIALNRAVALGELRGPEAALDARDPIAGRERLEGYPFYWAALAEVDRRLGRQEQARDEYRRAASLSRSRAERVSFERKADHENT